MTDDNERIALLIAYDGADFEGWQRHPGKRTIQGTLEDALAEVYGVPAVRIEGAGRTDRGAHAEGQVATVDAPRASDDSVDGTLDLTALRGALAQVLPPDLSVPQLAAVPTGFHARKAATGKTYRYALWLRDDAPEAAEVPSRAWSVGGPIDIEAMKLALPQLVGTHDFATFATKSNFEQASTVRTMHRADLTQNGPLVELRFEADGFLYKMVRSLVRTVLRVGEGRRSHFEVADILRSRDRARAPGSAPASGLTLERVHYDPPLFASGTNETRVPPEDSSTDPSDGSNDRQ